MVDINQEKLGKHLEQIIGDPELQGCKRFVKNFFGSVGGQTLEHAYLNYMDDLLSYSPTNQAIRENTTYLCWVFKEVTGADLETLAALEYKHHGPPKIYPLDF